MDHDDAIAFGTLFNESYNSLCYFSCQFINDNALAEDLVQDAFMKLYHARDNFSTVYEAKSFLYTCVRNAALNIIRRENVHEKYLDQQGTAEDEASFFDEIVQAEVVGAVHHAIESLPEQCKVVFKLGFFEDLKNQEIADQLGVSVNTIKTQKQRALRALRIQLRDANPLLALFGAFSFAAKFIL